MKSALFWLSPIINILLVNLLEQIGFRNKYIVNIKENDNILIDFLYTWLYFIPFYIIVYLLKR